ncbi:MAG TPA: peptidoglycan-associated lipoprotein Pal [Gammaproteobacteria bacterium]|nr:peptidoglycan-associated lipoprotein Pal [Gammaproteobacteria bacterium]
MKKLLLVLGAAGLLSVSACHRSDTVADAGATGTEVSSNTGANTAGQNGGGGITITAEEAAQQRLRQQLVVYFDYDQADIKPEFNQMLEAHGRFLAMNPNAQVRLEGHTDERGSREYNIGLGEQRAQSVRRVLLLQGATAAQVSTVSYGEERPAATGSDEESWRLNRRVELVYR